MNSSFEQTIERLAIDADIRDLTARFSDAVNRRDFNAFGDLFADDGAWEIGEPFPSRAAGRQNVTTMFKNLWAPWDFFFQMTHSGVIDVAADRQTATARWEIQEIARTPDGSQSYDNVAMYYDRLVRTPDGSWRFAGHRAESLTHDALKVHMDHGWRPAVIDALQLDLRGRVRLRRGARRNLYHRARPAHPGTTAGAHSNPGAPPHLPGRLPQRTGTDPTGQRPGKRPLLCRRCSVTEPPRIDRVQDQA